MGINTAHKLTHQIKQVTQEELLKIVHERALRRLGDKPTVDIDVSYVYRKAQNKDAKRRVCNIIRMSDILCQMGFRVVLVCDGNKRHHSKRAYYVRKADKYKKKIKLYNTRCEIMQINSELNNITSLDEKQELKKKEDKLLEECSKLEKYIYNAELDVGNNLFEMLINECNNKKKKDPNIDLTVVQAEFQADSVIAYRTMRQLNDIVFMADSDLAALCGKECISISKYNIKEEKNSNAQFTEMELFFADEKSVYDICNIIGLDKKNSRVSLSSCAIFDGIDSHYIRALIAVGVGCDVYFGGVPSVSPGRLHSRLKQLKEQYDNDAINIRDGLMEYYMGEFQLERNDCRSKDDLSKMIRIFADAFMFEPGNFRFDTESVVNTDTYYVHGRAPTYLHKYIEEFARDDEYIKIIETDDDNTCISTYEGPGTG